MKTALLYSVRAAFAATSTACSSSKRFFGNSTFSSLGATGVTGVGFGAVFFEYGDSTLGAGTDGAGFEIGGNATCCC